jgi:hypothetical protein
MTREQMIAYAFVAEMFPSEMDALGPRHLEMLRLAREDMRGECAKVCTALVTEYRPNMHATTVGAPYVARQKTSAECAKAIRNLEV